MALDGSMEDWEFSEALAMRDEIERLRADNEALSAEASALRLDAMRYRWLRNNSAGQWEHLIAVSQRKSIDHMKYIGPLCYLELDAAIDAAMNTGER